MSFIDDIKNEIENGTLVADETSEELDGYSPYAIWKMVAETYRAVGIDKVYQPQRFYQFAKAGQINGTKGEKRYTEEEAVAFVKKLVARDLNNK